MNLQAGGLAAAIALAATAATAQGYEPKSGYYSSGDVRLAYAAGDFDGDLFSGDVTLGFGDIVRFGGVSIGAEIGLLGYNSIHEETGRVADYFTVYGDTDFGRIAVGRPRIPFYDYVEQPKFGGNDIAGYELLGVRSATVAAHLRNNDYLGLRYDGTLNGIAVGASYVDFDNGPETSTTVAASKSFGPIKLGFGLEYLDGAGTSHANGEMQVAYDASVWGGSFTVTRSNSADATLLVADGWFDATDRITVDGQLAQVDGDTLYGASAEMSVAGNGYVGIGALDGDGISFTPSVYLGWKFDY